MHSCKSGSCPIITMVDILERKWALRIIKEIYHGNYHFNTLKRKMKGITPAMLSKRLKELERSKVIERKKLQGGKRQEVEYALGPQARHLMECWDMHGKKT